LELLAPFWDNYLPAERRSEKADSAKRKRFLSSTSCWSFVSSIVYKAQILPEENHLTRHDILIIVDVIIIEIISVKGNA